MNDGFVCLGYYSETDAKCLMCPDCDKCKSETLLRKMEKEIDKNDPCRRHNKD